MSLAVAAPAHATTVETETGGRLVVRGQGGEANALTIGVSNDGTHPARIADASAPVHPRRGCKQDGEHAVTCANYVIVLVVALDDGDDSLGLDVAPDAALDTQLFGGAGDDAITQSAGDSRATIAGGSGDDTITSGAASPSYVDGGLGDDAIQGGPGSEFLSGGGGRDTLHGGPGRDHLTDSDRAVIENGSRPPVDADLLDGGAGSDLVSYESRNEPVTVDLSSGDPAGQAGEGDELAGIESVQGGAAADRLHASSRRGVLYGAKGDDVIDAATARTIIRGQGGDDALTGGPAGDEISGGPGEDLVTTGAGNDSVSGGPGRDAVDAGAGDDRVYSRDDHFPELETVECGSGADVVQPDRLDLLQPSCEQARKYEYSPRFSAHPRHAGGRTVAIPFRCAHVRPRFSCSVEAELRRGGAKSAVGRASARGGSDGVIRLRLTGAAARDLSRRGHVTYHVVIQHRLHGTPRRAFLKRVDWRARVEVR